MGGVGDPAHLITFQPVPRHTPRLSSLASVAHPSLHPLVPEARRRRGEGTRGGGRKGRRDGPLHITYSTRSAGRVRPFPRRLSVFRHLSSSSPSLRSGGTEEMTKGDDEVTKGRREGDEESK